MNAAAADPAYAELSVASAFSFLRGASKPEELVDRAFDLGHAALAVTDRNTLAGSVRPWTRLRQLRRAFEEEKLADALTRLDAFRYVVGSRLAFEDGTPDILVYPADREGYGRLCRILTLGNTRDGVEKGDCRLLLDDLLTEAEGLLLAVVPPAWSDPAVLRPVLDRLTDAAPGRTWLAAAFAYGPADGRRLDVLAELAAEAGTPLLACNDVLYHAAYRRELQDVMTCIREGVRLSDAGRLLQPNAERWLKPPREMARLFKDHPAVIAETLRLVDRVDFDLSQLRYEYPHEPVPRGKTADGHLRRLAFKGAREIYGRAVPKKVVDGLRKELAFIRKRRYAHYFLTVHDVVIFARGKDILCQGRGSAANSVVCYCLGVTAIDPNEINALFERFISEDRLEPPDIDVDFEHERREDVIQYIYERYGRHRAAICATVIYYRPRSAIREVGKALGLTEDVTAALAGTVWGSFSGEGLPETNIRQAGLDPDNPVIRKAVDLAIQLIEFPRHLSQHVGGFVLTEGRLDETVPIGKGAIKDRTFIEWDKDDIDALGIMKVDVLALGMLSCIKRAFGLFEKHHLGDPPVTALADVPKDDPRVYDMLCKADSIGVFQVESRAQMNMLPRLKPREFYDLVIEVAIVRPGPIQGDMVHPYLRRKQGLEKPEFPRRKGQAPDEHNELEGLLHKTLGVPLFQEQAMQLAITAAGFTPSEADGLRRAMATFKSSGRMELYRGKFVGGMTRRGYEPGFALRCWKQIEGFGSYGFPESHAASFAKLVYVSAWLKCLHPAVFACALLNAQPMGFYAPAQIVRDAREHGVEVRPVDIEASEWDCTLEPRPEGGHALRLGFRQVDGFSKDWAERLVEGRRSGFGGFDELVRRSGLTPSQLQKLAEADVFRSLGLDRRAGVWKVRGIRSTEPAPLIAPLPDLEALPTLPGMALSEHVVADYQTTRLSLKAHPMSFLRPGFSARGVVSCAAVHELDEAAPVRTAGVVLVRQRPGTGKVVFITLEDETGVTNLVVLPEVFARYRKVVMAARLIEAHGRIQRTEQAKEVVHVLAHRLIDRSAALRTLAEPELDLKHILAHGDEVVKNGPGGSRRPLHSHPRNVRIMPPSRDFH